MSKSAFCLSSSCLLYSAPGAHHAAVGGRRIGKSNLRANPVRCRDCGFGRHTCGVYRGRRRNNLGTRRAAFAGGLNGLGSQQLPPRVVYRDDPQLPDGRRPLLRRRLKPEVVEDAADRELSVTKATMAILPPQRCGEGRALSALWKKRSRDPQSLPSGNQVNDRHEDGSADDRPQDPEGMPADVDHQRLRQLELGCKPGPKECSYETEGCGNDKPALKTDANSRGRRSGRTRSFNPTRPFSSTASRRLPSTGPRRFRCERVRSYRS